jgi:hypothetical protein
VLGLITAAALLLALQLWVIVTPLNISSDNAQLLARHATAGQKHKAAGAAAAAAAAADGAGGAAAAAGTVVAEAVNVSGQQQQQQQQAAGSGLNWSVPGVREWLMGSSGPTAAAAAAVPSPDVAVSGLIIVSGGGWPCIKCCFQLSTAVGCITWLHWDDKSSNLQQVDMPLLSKCPVCT